MQVNLKGKTALVTGASRGIGLECVRRCVEAECSKVYAVCILSDGLAKLKQELPQVETITVDLSNWQETQDKLSSLEPINALVNCAGVVEWTKTGQITEKEFDFHLAVNTKAVLNVSQIVANKLIESGQTGSIVNISSVASTKYTFDHLAYCASKAAVDNITRSMAIDFGSKGIRVNAVNPGITMTPMGTKMWSDPVKSAPMLARTPIGRFNQPEDVVNVVLFLLSDKSATVNGITIPVDGGYLCC